MQKIALSKITANNSYLRTETDIDSLKKSIETIGLINPITVNDKFELLAGGRRYQAMKDLGWEEIPVQIVELNNLEQELVSIDENLVRKPLNKLEFENCLNRGREIYEELNPEAIKIDLEVTTLTAEEKKVEKEKEENDLTSFAAITAEKVGLSKSIIKGAIKRDALSSKRIKEARGGGELSASQVNEIIKLKKEEQDKILPYIQDRPVREVRKIVEIAKQAGIDTAIEDSINTKTTPREFTQLGSLVKRVNKLLSQILLENIHAEEKDLKNILRNVKRMQAGTNDFLNKYGDEEDVSFSHTKDQVLEENVVQ